MKRILSADGDAVRYRLMLYGEMGRVQSDYYLMDGAMCLIVLETHYSDFLYVPGSDDLYTGMKRIDASGVPTDSENYITTWLSQKMTPRYGPGSEYAAQPDAQPMGETVKVYFQENGYAMVDCEGGKQVVRGWVPLSALELTIGC